MEDVIPDITSSNQDVGAHDEPNTYDFIDSSFNEDTESIKSIDKEITEGNSICKFLKSDVYTKLETYQYLYASFKRIGYSDEEIVLNKKSKKLKEKGWPSLLNYKCQACQLIPCNPQYCGQCWKYYCFKCFDQ